MLQKESNIDTIVGAENAASTGGIAAEEAPASPNLLEGMPPVLALSNCDDTLQQLAKVLSSPPPHDHSCPMTIMFEKLLARVHFSVVPCDSS